MHNIKLIVFNDKKQLIGEKKTNVIDKKPPKKLQLPARKELSLVDQCLTTEIMYQAVITRHNKRTANTYIIVADNSFKTRYHDRISSFKNKKRVVEG